MPQRILVVEDDDCIRQFHVEVLVSNGYHVDAAEDGAAGWAALSLDSYDLLITDNNMPKLSGVGLLRKLRAARMTLPVIMATGEPLAPEFALLPWLIPDATLIKPYTSNQLLGKVREVLRLGDRNLDHAQIPLPLLNKIREPGAVAPNQPASDGSRPARNPRSS